ncbi:MAG: leucine-rich repeat protein, partial [Lachnospiraceae bacterium]|nr:leucine-rich repeat protein [Lachnospiraceae bacterium]
YKCTSLATVTLVSSLTSIGDYAFSGCSALTAAYYPSTATDWAEVSVGDENTYLTEVLYYSISACTVALSTTGYIYDGKEKKPTVTVTDGTTTLTAGTDYTVTYSNNVNVGTDTAEVVVAGAGDYYGSVTKTFSIYIADISTATHSLSATSYTYDGTAKTPTVTVKLDGTTLTKGTDYTVTYSNNTNVGTATVTVSGANNYTGTLTASFTITAASISGGTVTLSSTSYTYDGTAKTPAPTVTVGSRTLTSGTDYTVTYSNNTNAGTATVKITGKGNYTGTLSKPFTINKASQTLTVTAAASSITAGSSTTITASGTGTITYSSGSTATATVTGKGVVTGKYPGTVTITVKASGDDNYNAATKTVKIKVTLAKGTVTSLTNKKSGILVKWKKITGASGYYVQRKSGSGSYETIATVQSGSTVKYTDTSVKSNNRKTYTYRVIAYYGSTKNSCTAKKIVRLTTPKLSSVKNSSSKKATVKWTKVTKVTGYQIQYSTSSSFATSKKKTVTKASTVKKTLSSLTKGKTYYVRIRTYYKTSSGTVYYSAWSTKKKVKITK